MSLSAYPNRPGTNLLQVRATSTRRVALADIDVVLVRFPSADGARTETVQLSAAPGGIYQATTGVLSRAGDLQAQVVIRRAAQEDAVADLAWELPALAPRERLISDRPWAGILNGLAAALLVAEVATAVVIVRRSKASRRRLPVGASPRLHLGSTAGGGGS